MMHVVWPECEEGLVYSLSVVVTRSSLLAAATSTDTATACDLHFHSRN
jgi:hypothetical protein